MHAFDPLLITVMGYMHLVFQQPVTCLALPQEKNINSANHLHLRNFPLRVGYFCEGLRGGFKTNKPTFLTDLVMGVPCSRSNATVTAALAFICISKAKMQKPKLFNFLFCKNVYLLANKHGHINGGLCRIP